MLYKEMKTLTALLAPQENGWQVVHKKYKDPYGTVLCKEVGDTVEISTQFGTNVSQRAEALEAVQNAVFENTGAKTVVIDGAVTARADWQAEKDEKLASLRKTREDYADVLGKTMHCVMDRPLGSRHPRYPEMIYPVNYGYIPGVMAGDNAEQDVYVLGPTEPLQTFDGVIIAVILRFDDCEDKWVMAEKTGVYTEEEIRQILDFQEKYYTSEIIM